MTTRRLLGTLVGCVAGALATATLATPPTLAAAADETRFFAGLPYTGEFASPQVLVDGGRYYAVATNEDGNNLPAMHSDDLGTWVPRDPLPDYDLYRSWAGFNDAMPEPGSWAARRFIDGRMRHAVWAPAIARMGGRYVVAYAAVVDFKVNRLCIGLGYADTAEGKYTSPKAKPVVCSEDTRGSIDPDLIRVGDRNYLVWKNSGVKGSTPTTVWIRRLNARATGFASGSRAQLLLKTEQAWEGNVIEAPDMVRYGGRFYLFYSGNSYTTRSYATGYAICKSVTGPCRRPTSRPLLSTGKVVVGPGGAAGFKDLDGRLRLAYHAWSTAEVGATTPKICNECPPRRLHIATLEAGSGGLLEVSRLR
jgi:beta-xylosidase